MVSRTRAQPLTDKDVAGTLALVEAAAGNLAGPNPSPGLEAPSEGVFVVAFRQGVRLGDHYSQSGTIADSIFAGVRAIGGKPSSVALCVVHDRREADLADLRARREDVHAGVLGLELKAGRVHARISPLESVTGNRGPRGHVSQFLRENRLPDNRDGWSQVEATWFDCDQVLVELDGDGQVLRMFRGNTVVPMAGVTRDNLAATARALADYMRRSVLATGQIRYLVEPSRDTMRSGDNAIRQWMATIALIRRGGAEPDLIALAKRNIDFNLGAFYREEGGLGIVQMDGKEAKLGAAALALIAVSSHPMADAWAGQARALFALTVHLQNPDGSFRTFYKPRKQPSLRSHNFYPGETLLAWALRYGRSPGPELRERFFRSFDYYRTWHRQHRNPAFVPWHTQAAYLMWGHTRDPRLPEFIFEMNDWLVDYQEWDAAVYPDTRGRFYDERRPQYGPPHASSTGVYLEGLIDAHSLAVALKDGTRAARYKRAILRGLRSVMQLTFTDAVDLFYLKDPTSVTGGVRTTVANNTIRIDNVQHNLMAMMKILTTWDAEMFVQGP